MITNNSQAGRLLLYLEKNYTYNPENGIVIRLNKTTWNSKVGIPVGISRKDGYLAIGFENRPVLLHRAIWLIVYKKMPDAFIDHINGKKYDNRLCNLREATKAQNGRNQPARKNNKLGIKGVIFDKSRVKYVAQATHNKQHFNLGRFDKVEDAEKAYKDFASKNHGEFYYFNEKTSVMEYSLVKVEKAGD